MTKSIENTNILTILNKRRERKEKKIDFILFLALIGIVRLRISNKTYAETAIQAGINSIDEELTKIIDLNTLEL